MNQIGLVDVTGHGSKAVLQVQEIEAVGRAVSHGLGLVYEVLRNFKDFIYSFDLLGKLDFVDGFDCFFVVFILVEKLLLQVLNFLMLIRVTCKLVLNLLLNQKPIFFNILSWDFWQ